MIKKATALKIQDRYQDIFEWKKELNGLSIKPAPLVEKEDLEEKVKFGSTAKVFGDTVHTVPGTGTAKAEDIVGATMPLREEEPVGVTVPLREEGAVGVTVPIQEEEPHTLDKTEETVKKEEETERRDRKKKWIAGIVALAAVVVLVVVIGRKSPNVMVKNTWADLDTEEIPIDRTDWDVFGNAKLDRTSIRSISFLDTKEDMPDGAWDVSKEQNGTVMAWTDESGRNLYLAASGKITVESARYLFGGYSGLEKISFNNCFDTSQVTDMRGMFYMCSNLTELDISGFDTSQVTDMRGMFYMCSNLTELDISGFDTSQVTNMSQMFLCCINLSSLDVRGFDTSQVTNMSQMFWCCAILRGLDVSGFDTSQVTDIDEMFEGADVTAEEAGLSY